MTVVMAGQTSSGKIYYKNAKMLRQDMMGMIIITKHPVDMEELQKQNPMIDVDDFKERFEKHNMKKAGTESIQGYKCDIYEGDVKFAEDQPAMSMKYWYSKKLEYPIKGEVVLPAPLGKTISTVENIKTGEQPADLFKVSSGYAQAKDVPEARGIAAFPMP